MPTLTKLFSVEETATHNTKDDCWIVIDGKVYDVSAYLDDHPGGEDVILETAGKDATDDFEDAGHSKDARNTMEDFFIGEIDNDTPSSPDIPELEIFRKNQPAQDILDLTKQYWAVTLAVAGISVVVGIIYLRRN